MYLKNVWTDMGIDMNRYEIEYFWNRYEIKMYLFKETSNSDKFIVWFFIMFYHGVGTKNYVEVYSTLIQYQQKLW